jgi:hypothetical protein
LSIGRVTAADGYWEWENDQGGRSWSLTKEVRAVTPVSQIPLKETSARKAGVPIPRQTVEVAATGRTSRRERGRVLRYAALGLATVGIGTALGLGAVNALDTGSLQSDVTALRTDVTTLQDQVSGLRVELARRDYGYSVEREHLAQAPTAADYGYSVEREHLAQAPTIP